MMEFKLVGKDSVTRTVCKGTSSGVVNVPKEWSGKKVVVILEGK